MSETTGKLDLKCSGNIHVYGAMGGRCACGERTWGDGFVPMKVTVTPSPVASMMGWECPRCRTIHAPNVAACWCPAPTLYSTSTSLDVPAPDQPAPTPEKASLEMSDD